MKSNLLVAIIIIIVVSVMFALLPVVVLGIEYLFQLQITELYSLESWYKAGTLLGLTVFTALSSRI